MMVDDVSMYAWWYLDDGDILLHPEYVKDFLASNKVASEAVGGKRNEGKTEIIYYCTKEEFQANYDKWNIKALEEAQFDIKCMANPGQKTITLGCVCGPVTEKVKHFQEKINTVRKMM